MDESCRAAFSTTLNEMNEMNITDTEEIFMNPFRGCQRQFSNLQGPGHQEARG